MVGLCLATGYQFQTIGLVRTTPSKSAFITGLVVVLVPLFSSIPGLRPAGARAPRWNAFVGAALAFAGIILLTTPAVSGGMGSTAFTGWFPDLSSINIGDVLTFGCAVGFAFHCLALGHVSPRIGFQPLALLQVGFCAVFMAVSLPFIEHPHIEWTPGLIAALSDRGRAGHGGGVLDSELGAVDSAVHAHGAHHDHGAGVRVDHVVPGDGRAARAAAGVRRRDHPGGNRHHRAGSATARAHRARSVKAVDSGQKTAAASCLALVCGH